MKSHLLTLSLIVVSLFPAATQTLNGIPLPSRSTTEFSQFASEPLKNESQTYYFYNADSTLYHELEDIWDQTTNIWRRKYQRFYSNGPDGRVLVKLDQQLLPNNVWVNTSRQLNDYYPDINYLQGQATSIQSQQWDVSSQQWEMYSIRNITAYGPGTGALEGAMAESVFDVFSDGEKVYGSVNTLIQSATPNGVRIVENAHAIYNVSLDMNEFIYREQFIYNDAASLDYDTIYEYAYDPENMNWSATPSRQTIQIIVGNERKIEYYIWLDDRWTPEFRRRFITNSDNQLVNYTVEQWYQGAYKKVFGVKTDYNADRSIATEVAFVEDTSTPTGGLFPYHKATYEYGGAFVGTQAPDHQTNVKVFPNPTTDLIQVTLENAASAAATGILYDSKGRVTARTFINGNTASFSLNGQAAGIYFLHIEQGSSVKVIPVIKH